MKITIVTPYYAPAWAYGGPPKVFSVLAEQLTKNGHSVSVITSDALDENRNPVLREDLHGVRIYRNRLISNALGYKAKIFYVPRLLNQTKKIVDTSDVVLFGDVRSILNWQLCDYVHRKKIRYGVFAFGQIPYGNGWKSLIKKVFDVLWVRRFIRQATWCLAQTNHEMRMYREYFQIPKKNIHLLPLPVLVRNQMVENAPHTDFLSYGIGPKDKVILFVGRFHYLKGVDILIQSCIPLIRKNRKIKLVLIGRDDGALDSLCQMVPHDLKTSIQFPGPMYGNALSAWYRRAQCFAFTPRFYEETSTAALEALSYGCPVVTVPESEIPYLSEYNAGVSVQLNESKIRDGIGTVFQNREKRKVNALHLIEDHYEVKKVTAMLLSFIL